MNIVVPWYRYCYASSSLNITTVTATELLVLLVGEHRGSLVQVLLCPLGIITITATELSVLLVGEYRGSLVQVMLFPLDIIKVTATKLVALLVRENRRSLVQVLCYAPLDQEDVGHIMFALSRCLFVLKFKQLLHRRNDRFNVRNEYYK